MKLKQTKKNKQSAEEFEAIANFIITVVHRNLVMFGHDRNRKYVEERLGVWSIYKEK